MAGAGARVLIAGYVVTALDAFGDLDRHPGVRTLSVTRDFGARFTPAAAARAARSLECDAVSYLSSFENQPAAVRALAAGRALWGNGAATLARVRDPIALAHALAGRGCAVPRVRPHDDAPPTCDATRWLVKPRASGGGQGVRAWRAGARVSRGCYLQEQVDGIAGSVVFVAAGGRAVLLGVSRQLAGDAAFGASGFRYCGSVLAGAGDAMFAHDSALVRAAGALALAAAAEFSLVGVNGVDFIARDGAPYAIEVNPRYSASMELVEQEYGISVFGAHARACAAGALPSFDLAAARARAGAVGKAVLFARAGLRVGDTRPWLDDPTVRDVPHPGEAIPAGAPVCTVFARGADGASCYAALVRRADAVYEQLRAWERAAA